jgi:hypothetical protein
MTKESVKYELAMRGLDKYPFRFYAKSPYQKNRYKDEFVESEAWINHNVITSESFADDEYRINFFDMIVSEIKN